MMITRVRFEKSEQKKKGLAPRRGADHFSVLSQMRDVGHDGARIHGHLFPHAIVHGTDGGSETKHTRLPLVEQGDGDRNPELDVPLILANLRVRPAFLHDDPERWIKHPVRLGELSCETGALEAARKHWNRVCLGGEATFICMCRALNFDGVNRRKVDGRLVIR